MIKYFCDCCGNQIVSADVDRGDRTELGRLTATIKRGNATLKVEVLESKDGCANAGQFCRYCVLDAFNTLDDRPRAP